MPKKAKEQFSVGDKVFVDQFECNGVIKEIEESEQFKGGVMYTVELENGQTKHFTAEDLEEA